MTTARWGTTPLRVSPSPVALFEQLSDEEKVAIDLIQLALGGVLDASRAEVLSALVPAEGRRAYLRTLAMQMELPSCAGDERLDAEVATWTAARVAARARYAAEWEVAREQRAVRALMRDATRRRRGRLHSVAATAPEDLAWLETLSPEVRRSVERHRRRRSRRQRR